MLTHQSQTLHSVNQVQDYFLLSLISLSSLRLCSFYTSSMLGIFSGCIQCCPGSFQTPSGLLSLWITYVLLHLSGSFFTPQMFSFNGLYGTKINLYESNLSLLDKCFSGNGAKMLFQKNYELEIKNASFASSLWPMGSHLQHYQEPALLVLYNKKKTHTKALEMALPSLSSRNINMVVCTINAFIFQILWTQR